MLFRSLSTRPWGSGVSPHTHTHTHTHTHRARPFLRTLGSCRFPGQQSTQAEAQTQQSSNAFSSLEGLVPSATLSSGPGGGENACTGCPGVRREGRRGRGHTHTRTHAHTHTHPCTHGKPPPPRAPENHISWVPTAFNQAASLCLLRCPGRPCGGQEPCWRPPGPDGRAGGPGS